MKYFLILIVFFVSGCQSNGHKQFYTEYQWVKNVAPENKANMQFLNPKDEPRVYNSNNLNRDVKDLEAKRYIPIGYSSFNGSYSPKKDIIKQAKSVGALLVLTSSKYTNTESSNYTLYMPSSQTTTHSGNVHSTVRTTNSVNTGYVDSTYSGTSTTRVTNAYNGTTHSKKYDQIALYFVKDNTKLKFGLMNKNLTVQQRKALGRNTGSLVTNVLEKTPAFYADILVDDLIINIDGVDILDADQAIKIMRNVPVEQKSSELTILRNGEEKKITVNFGD